MSEPFLLGVNYWPRQTAMYWWRDFDPAQVDADVAQLKRAGLAVIRLFLLWEDFQPHPRRVSVRSLGHLVTVADIAHRVGMKLMPTLFTGHMSGVNWLPEWMLGSERAIHRFPIFSNGRLVERTIRNYYHDREVIEAQKLLIREVARALGDHPALWAWDLGNEPSTYVIPSDRQAAVAWLDEMVDELKRCDPGHPVTLGLHMEDLEEDRRLGPAEAARRCDFLSMHGYPIYATWADGPMDVAVLPFLGALTRWLGDKEVLFQEFGMPTWPTLGPPLSPAERAVLARSRVTLVSESEQAEFYRRALPLLHQHGFMGAMAWCYGDYDPRLWSQPPCDEKVHERFFGLFRYDGSAKPAVAVMREFLGLHRVESEPDTSWIDIPREAYYRRPSEHIKRLYRRFKRRFFSS